MLERVQSWHGQAAAKGLAYNRATVLARLRRHLLCQSSLRAWYHVATSPGTGATLSSAAAFASRRLQRRAFANWKAMQRLRTQMCDAAAKHHRRAVFLGWARLVRIRIASMRTTVQQRPVAMQLARQSVSLFWNSTNCTTWPALTDALRVKPL